MEGLKDALAIAKDLLQIAVLALTAWKLLREGNRKSKPKRRRGR